MLSSLKCDLPREKKKPKQQKNHPKNQPRNKAGTYLILHLYLVQEDPNNSWNLQASLSDQRRVLWALSLTPLRPREGCVRVNRPLAARPAQSHRWCLNRRAPLTLMGHRAGDSTSSRLRRLLSPLVPSQASPRAARMRPTPAGRTCQTVRDPPSRRPLQRRRRLRRPEEAPRATRGTREGERRRGGAGRTRGRTSPPRPTASWEL